MLLGLEIGQRWPEAVMHSCGSYFVPVPTYYLIAHGVSCHTIFKVGSKLFDNVMGLYYLN